MSPALAPRSEPSAMAGPTRVLVLALVLAGCGIAPAPALRHSPGPDAIRAAYVLHTGDAGLVARVVTQAAQCPEIRLDGAAPQPMSERAGPATLPARMGGTEASDRPAVFRLRSCETVLPPDTQALAVDGLTLPLPRREIRRVLIVGDTGCRLSQQLNQDCNDPAAWPFARIAERAAAMKPDLVIHLGDMHYREGPCPVTRPGCAGSPWGYGDDTWEADLFHPAAPLLAAAPWVVVRGNHESCARGGQGWFRFMDPQPLTELRSCNDPRNDAQGDFSEPFAVPLDAQTQLVVFDSSLAGLKPYGAQDATGQRYARLLAQADALAQRAPHNLFLNHHPLLAYAPRDGGTAVWPGNAGLQSVFAQRHGARLFAPNFDMAWHGHVHLFEAIAFDSDHPFTLVVGNSGSAADPALPSPLPATPRVSAGARVRAITTHADFGFSTLDRVAGGWALTAWSVDGRVLARCSFEGAAGRCQQP